jgi:hypothetical protein
MMPQWLYNALPFGYALAGLTAIITLNHPIALASSVLFGGASWLVFYWRH